MNLTIKSPAKVNIFLRILGKREDGYHNIQSILQMIDLCDILTFKKIRSGITLESNSTEIPLDSNNIVFRAAKLLKGKNRISDGVYIYIEKNIPVAAGLGGGSSNAAATLVALNRIWGLGYSMNDLMDIGGSIGSDIPFFLRGPTAFVEGKGEIIYPIILKNGRWLVLVNPGIKVSTSWAYSRLDEVRTSEEKRRIWLTKRGKDNKISMLKGSKLDLIEVSPWMQNDLEPITAQENRVIEEIKDELIGMKARGSTMSGSGATVFGIFMHEEGARVAAERLIRNRPWRVWVAKTLTHTPILEFRV